MKKSLFSDRLGGQVEGSKSNLNLSQELHIKFIENHRHKK